MYIYYEFELVEKCFYISYFLFLVFGEYYFGFVDVKYNVGRFCLGEV